MWELNIGTADCLGTGCAGSSQACRGCRSYGGHSKRLTFSPTSGKWKIMLDKGRGFLVWLSLCSWGALCSSPLDCFHSTQSHVDPPRRAGPLFVAQVSLHPSSTQTSQLTWQNRCSLGLVRAMCSLSMLNGQGTVLIPATGPLFLTQSHAEVTDIFCWFLWLGGAEVNWLSCDWCELLTEKNFTL